MTCSRQSAALLGAKPFSTFLRCAQAKSAISRRKARAVCKAFRPTFERGSSGSSSSAAARSSSQRCTVSEAQGCTPCFLWCCARRKRTAYHGAMTLQTQQSQCNFASEAFASALPAACVPSGSGFTAPLSAQFCVHMTETPSKVHDFSRACGHAWGCVWCCLKER